MYSELTSIRLTPELRAGVREYAAANELKESTVIRMAVKRFITAQRLGKSDHRKQKVERGGDRV